MLSRLPVTTISSVTAAAAISVSSVLDCAAASVSSCFSVAMPSRSKVTVYPPGGSEANR